MLSFANVFSLFQIFRQFFVKRARVIKLGFWTSRKNCLELVKLSNVSKVHLSTLTECLVRYLAYLDKS
jgi:hypothetical protein